MGSLQSIAFISHPAPAATVVTLPTASAQVYPAADLITGVGPDGQGSMHIVADSVAASNVLPFSASTATEHKKSAKGEHGKLALDVC